MRPADAPGSNWVDSRPRSLDQRSLDLIDQLEDITGRLRHEIGRVIVGQDAVVDQLLITLLAQGHAILEGVPGLAKTLLVSTLGQALSLEFGRIQFTPDLMPSDVTGTLIVQEDRSTGDRDFAFRKGPVFTNLLLADEINRTPPKTQASLLEGMSERFVTVGGKRHKLPEPFFVLATQNPIEQEGTYPLPEAQLDRFLFKIVIDYPDVLEEEAILKRTTGTASAMVASVVSREKLLAMQQLVRALPTTKHLQEYATRIVRRTRPNDEGASDWVRANIAWGAGPRAVQALLLAAKAHTLLSGRFSVTRSDIRAVALPVLRHRILPSFLAEADGFTVDSLVLRLVEDTPAFTERPDYDAVSRRILRL